jgi:glycosyltransferase involved in cell wall biosynthesis
VKILVVSNGPVPGADDDVVEGGGLRCWGLALGLREHGHDVTVATNAVYGNSAGVVRGVRIVPYTLNPAFARLVHGSDAVVVSYCMGQVTDFVVHALSSTTLLIGDAYVPIHVEIAAREATDLATEQREYLADLPRWNANLARCDVLLVASPEQELYYTGALAALGRVTPESYRHKALVVTPFGIDPEERVPRVKAQSKDALEVLWFGGVYPWFDGGALVESVEEARQRGVPVNLTLAGARNPFVKHDRFEEHAAQVEGAARSAGHVTVVGWTPYRQRAAVYEGADLLVTLNTVGPETKLSWRTRLVDYVWSGLPLLTNGGDPLAERLLAAGAAMRVQGNDRHALASALVDAWQRKNEFATMRAAMAAQRAQLSWKNCTAELAELLEQPDVRLRPTRHAGAVAALTRHRNGVVAQKVRAAGWYGMRARRYARAHGWRATAVTAGQVLQTRLPRTPLSQHEAQHLWVISHQLDNSGAPLVATDIAKDGVASRGLGSTTLVGFPPVASERVEDAETDGVRVVALQAGLPAPRPSRNDDVVLNSLAVPRHVILGVLDRIEGGRLRSVQWYIHEDLPELWWHADVAGRVTALAEQSRLRLCAPSQAVAASHRAFLGLGDEVEVVPYRIQVAPSQQAQRTPADFTDIVFHVTGSAWDGRKGHATVLAAFQSLILQHDVDDPRFRRFELHFNGLGSDFASSKLKALGEQILGSRFTWRPPTDRPTALANIRRANVVVCDSVYEALPIYVLEGMAMGQLVLRNSCAGMVEQLADGKNGWWIGDDNLPQFCDALLQVLDRTRSSDLDLAAMSERSQEMVQPYLDADYKHFATWPDTRAGD